MVVPVGALGRIVEKRGKIHLVKSHPNADPRRQKSLRALLATSEAAVIYPCFIRFRPYLACREFRPGRLWKRNFDTRRVKLGGNHRYHPGGIISGRLLTTTPRSGMVLRRYSKTHQDRCHGHTKQRGCYLLPNSRRTI